MGQKELNLQFLQLAADIEDRDLAIQHQDQLEMKKNGQQFITMELIMMKHNIWHH